MNHKERIEKFVRKSLDLSLFDYVLKHMDSSERPSEATYEVRINRRRDGLCVVAPAIRSAHGVSSLEVFVGDDGDTLQIFNASDFLSLMLLWASDESEYQT